MGRQFKRGTLVENTAPKKKKDEKNRTRNLMLNFHVSEQEKELIEARIALSGLTKVDYFVDSCLHQDIHVTGNVKTFDSMRERMKVIDQHLQQIASVEELDETILTELRTILEILDSVLGQNEGGG